MPAGRIADHPALPIVPPATLGILGGGQLGRLIALAARRSGYRIAVLDPDPDAPAMAVAETSIIARYDDVDGARELGRVSDVVTYELEHIALAAADAASELAPLRPGLEVLRVTQDRLAEREWLESVGAPVAAWVPVRAPGDLRVALERVGMPARLKRAIGGYDGRGQARIRDEADVRDAGEMLAGGVPHLLEREVPFAAELSVVVARSADGSTAAFPVAENEHREGILARTWAPARVDARALAEATALGERLVSDLRVVGTLTAELFLVADGSLLVNELAPRVHNSGHYTAEACATSQFEQHVRAVCGLPLGSAALLQPAAMVNLLGDGGARPACPTGLEDALADPAAKVTIYDKRTVFERRKMGHLTVTAGTPDDAMARATIAAGRVGWR